MGCGSRWGVPVAPVALARTLSISLFPPAPRAAGCFDMAGSGKLCALNQGPLETSSLHPALSPPLAAACPFDTITVPPGGASSTLLLLLGPASSPRLFALRAAAGPAPGFAFVICALGAHVTPAFEPCLLPLITNPPRHGGRLHCVGCCLQWGPDSLFASGWHHTSCSPGWAMLYVAPFLRRLLFGGVHLTSPAPQGSTSMSHTLV